MGDLILHTNGLLHFAQAHSQQFFSCQRRQSEPHEFFVGCKLGQPAALAGKWGCIKRCAVCRSWDSITCSSAVANSYREKNGSALIHAFRNVLSGIWWRRRLEMSSPTRYLGRMMTSGDASSRGILEKRSQKGIQEKASRTRHLQGWRSLGRGI